MTNRRREHRRRETIRAQLRLGHSELQEKVLSAKLQVCVWQRDLLVVVFVFAERSESFFCFSSCSFFRLFCVRAFFTLDWLFDLLHSCLRLLACFCFLVSFGQQHSRFAYTSNETYERAQIVWESSRTPWDNHRNEAVTRILRFCARCMISIGFDRS